MRAGERVAGGLVVVDAAPGALSRGIAGGGSSRTSIANCALQPRTLARHRFPPLHRRRRHPRSYRALQRVPPLQFRDFQPEAGPWSAASGDRRSEYFTPPPDLAGAIRKRYGMTRRILRLKDVKEATGLSRSSIYALQQRGIFPQSIRIGPKATGWYEDEVQNYIETRPRTEDDRTGKRR